MKPRSADAGFTLIELLLVMVLIGIMGASTAMVALQGARSYSGLVERKESLHNARLAMERISREVRQASSASPVSASRLRIDGGVLELYHDAATNTLKLGGTSQPPGGLILADGINAIAFTMDNTNDWVTVELTEAGGQKYRTTVYLRKELFSPP